ncbi:hypothetical protein BpHYR1_004249 [Brachionus plicatilis]|uniref:Uncharacterized protein n=1 Tax=Brachionus plicatilis TaxID=10195 RepID=A0A3M7RTE9_BRAPC|nr:hypothetical protein BpHYR1_004249 [Brachionus plicatilis]
MFGHLIAPLVQFTEDRLVVDAFVRTLYILPGRSSLLNGFLLSDNFNKKFKAFFKNYKFKNRSNKVIHNKFKTEYFLIIFQNLYYVYLKAIFIYEEYLIKIFMMSAQGNFLMKN